MFGVFVSQSIPSATKKEMSTEFWLYWKSLPRGILRRRWAKQHVETAANLWPDVIHCGTSDQSCPSWCPWGGAEHPTDRRGDFLICCFHSHKSFSVNQERDVFKLVDELKSFASNPCMTRYGITCYGCRWCYLTEQLDKPKPEHPIHRWLPKCLAHLVEEYLPHYNVPKTDLEHLGRIGMCLRTPVTPPGLPLRLDECPQ